jgi:two-component system NtrC family sensor kinase
MDTQGYRKFRLKIVAITLSFSLIPLVVLGIFLQTLFSKTYSEKIAGNLEIMVEDKRKAVDMYLDERVAQLKTLAFSHSFAQLRDEKYLNYLFGVMQSGSRSLVDLGVIDKNGDHVAYVGPYEQLKTVNYKDQEWFQEVVLKGQYLSDVFMGFRKFPHIIIAVMRREGDQFLIIRATIDSNAFDALVKSVQVGERGDAYLVNREEVLQTPSRFWGPVLSKIALPTTNEFSGIRIEERTLAGRSMILGQAWLTKAKWMLVIMADPREEFALLSRATSLIFAIVFAGIGIILCGTILIARSLVNKLIASDRAKAEIDANVLQSSKMAALGKMAAGVAHEVNNPLTLIRESAGWIKDLIADEDPQNIPHFDEIEKALNKIEYHVDRAKGVTHRMLGFGRRMEPVQENVSLNMIADQTIKFLENEAMHRNITIEKEFRPDLPETATDTSQMQQVVLNILENAIDAVGKDGVIRVRSGVHAERNEIFLAISDTGHGIAKDKLDKIFDPFFTTKKPGEGTGLGLAITYSILQKLGGRIEVASEVGKGSTFTVFLPVK